MKLRWLFLAVTPSLLKRDSIEDKSRDSVSKHGLSSLFFESLTYVYRILTALSSMSEILLNILTLNL